MPDSPIEEPFRTFAPFAASNWELVHFSVFKQCIHYFQEAVQYLSLVGNSEVHSSELTLVQKENILDLDTKCLFMIRKHGEPLNIKIRI